MIYTVTPKGSATLSGRIYLVPTTGRVIDGNLTVKSGAHLTFERAWAEYDKKTGAPTDLGPFVLDTDKLHHEDAFTLKQAFGDSWEKELKTWIKTKVKEGYLEEGAPVKKIKVTIGGKPHEIPENELQEFLASKQPVAEAPIVFPEPVAQE